MANVHVEGSRGLAHSMLIGAPPDEVWRAIATPEGLIRWFADRAVLTATGYRLEWDRPHQVEAVDLRLRESKPPTRLVFDWDSTVPGHDTRAVFELSPEAGGTRLVFTEAGFGEGVAWDHAVDHIGDGWDAVLPRLPELWPVAPLRAIRREADLPGTAAAAFRLLTHEVELGRWLAPAARFDAHRGGQWRLDAPAFPGPAAGRVNAYEPGRRLRLFWRWSRLPIAPTEVEITLDDRETGVHVEVTHGGWSHDDASAGTFDDMDRGWGQVLQDLGRELAKVGA